MIEIVKMPQIKIFDEHGEIKVADKISINDMEVY